jgi:hypothetical protein
MSTPAAVLQQIACELDLVLSVQIFKYAYQIQQNAGKEIPSQDLLLISCLL